MRILIGSFAHMLFEPGHQFEARSAAPLSMISIAKTEETKVQLQTRGAWPAASCTVPLHCMQCIIIMRAQ